MRFVKVFLVLFLLAPQAKADWFSTLVGYSCDTANDQLIVYYKGAYNEAGEAMLKQKGENEWDPWLLIETDKDGEVIRSTKTIERTCALTHGNYEIRLGPSPGNSKVTGLCGAHMGAWVEVVRGTHLVVPRRGMNTDCNQSEPVTTKITISPELVITTIPASKFYQ